MGKPTLEPTLLTSARSWAQRLCTWLMRQRRRVWTWWTF